MTFSADLWGHSFPRTRLLALNKKAKSQQWDANGLDWAIPSRFGSALPEDSAFALAAFQNSDLSAYGPGIWEAFRWEFQSWMVTQFLSGEHAALISANRLLEIVTDEDAKACVANQVVDEARHVAVFTRYINEKIANPYPLSSSYVRLMRDALNDARWDFTVLGMQIVVEGVALAAFRLGSSHFHDELIKRICSLAARDEARHVSFGIHSLDGFYENLTQGELKERQEFVLEGLDLLGRSFLLTEIWERLEINKADGHSFAKNSSLTKDYRQAISMKSLSCLERLKLITPDFRDRLGGLDLLDPARDSSYLLAEVA